MDKELVKYYEDYFDLFSRPGWKIFEEEFKDSLESLRTQLETSVDPDTSRIQGQIKELKILCGFKDFIVASYEQLKEDEKEQQ